MPRYLIVGLGNPGRQYQDTRHNLGFMALDEQARRLNQKFNQGPGVYEWMHSVIDGSEVVFLKPMTYMNRSGIAVADARLRLEASLDRCLVILDDLALPLGRLRLRSGGSDGGHNGLASVIRYLHSRQIPRLRMGIGNPDSGNTIDYVLSPFYGGNRPLVRQMVGQAAEAVSSFITQGIHPAMNVVNTFK